MSLRKPLTSIALAWLAALSCAANAEDLAGQELRVAIDDGSDDTALFVTLRPELPARAGVDDCLDSYRMALDDAERTREPITSKEVSATN